MSNYFTLLNWSVVFDACRTVNQYWEVLHDILQQLSESQCQDHAVATINIYLLVLDYLF